MSGGAGGGRAGERGWETGEKGPGEGEKGSGDGRYIWAGELFFEKKK